MVYVKWISAWIIASSSRLLLPAACTWSYLLWSSLALQFREQTRNCSAGLSNSKKLRNVVTHCEVARMQAQALPGFKGESIVDVVDVGVGNDSEEFSCKKRLCIVLFDGILWVGHWNPSACILRCFLHRNSRYMRCTPFAYCPNSVILWRTVIVSACTLPSLFWIWDLAISHNVSNPLFAVLSLAQ